MQPAHRSDAMEDAMEPARASTPDDDLVHPGALVHEEQERGGVRCTATFSPDPGRTYRYTLGRTWDDRLPVATFLMLNPSTADAYCDDATIRRCLGFARAWHAGGLLVVNLYALRATNPAELLTHADPVGPANDAVLTTVLTASLAGADTGTPLVAAWGAHRAAATRAHHVYALLRGRGLRPRCLGTTSAGHPRHPLRLSATTPLLEYPGPARDGPGRTPADPPGASRREASR